MKNLFLLTSAAILLGTASFADRIAASYTAQGYTNVQVTKSHGNVTVTAEKDGISSSFAAKHDAGKHHAKAKGKGKGKTKVKENTVGSGGDDGTVVGDDIDTDDQVSEDIDTGDEVADDSSNEGSDVETDDDRETD